MSMIVARYENMIFTCESSRKLGGRLPCKIEFLNFFEGSDEMFIATYKPRYPQSIFQIYKHPKKAMFKGIRDGIRESVKDPKVRDRLREYDLNKLIT